MRYAAIFIAIGLVFLVGTGLLVLGSYGHGAFADWVQSWWSIATTHHDSGRYHNRTYSSDRGTEVMFWGFAIAAGSLFIGFGLLFGFDFDNMLRDRRWDRY